jgi:hypothetical protein
MRAPSTRIRKTLLWGSGPVAVLLAGAMVWQGSQAAFTAETYNAGNNWNSGTVLLTNDGSTAGAMFSLQNLVPMQTGPAHCITVTAATTVAGVVKTYFDNNIPDGLENNLTLKVEQGSGGSFSSCTGFTPSATVAAQPLATYFNNNSSFDTGILQWNKGTGTQSTSYRFTWVFDTTGLTQAEINALEGKSVRTDIEWELQNTN